MILPLQFHYICVCIDMFVYVIQLLIVWTLFLEVLFYIYPVHVLLYHCVVMASVFLSIFPWMLYLYLLWYVGVIHTVCLLVVIHIWEVCHLYLLIYYATVSILVCLYPKYWINTSLFEFTVDLSRELKHIYSFLHSYSLI